MYISEEQIITYPLWLSQPNSFLFKSYVSASFTLKHIPHSAMIFMLFL